MDNSTTTNFQKLQTKKSKKVRKHHGKLRKMGKLLRYAEVCVVLVLVSKLTINHLPSTLKNTNDYFRNLMGSPRFVFLIGNLIIITLFAQSGHLFCNSAKHGQPSESDIYLEFLQNSIIHHKPETGLEVKKDYRRCQSDIVVKRMEPPRVLQRSETEKVVNYSYPEDVMSNHEFRLKVEAFIARQQTLRTTQLCN